MPDIEMKTTRYIRYASLLAAFLCLGLSSCRTDDAELNKGEEELALMASAQRVALNQRTADNRALSFGWTSGTNRGTGAAIRYTFEMDVKGNDFRGGFKVDLGKTDSRMMHFTHREMNDTIAKYWDLPLEEERMFEARILADVAAERQVSNTVEVALTTYRERFLNLYLVGSSTAGGWDNQRATAMNPSEEEPGAFVWSGSLRAGELKFITQLGSFDNYFSRGDDDGSLLFNDPADKKFVIPRNAQYRIALNIETLTIDIQPVEGTREPYDALWMIGDAADGWDASRGRQMTASGEGRFEWRGMLRSGELKFIAVPGHFAPSFGRGGSDGELRFREKDSEPDVNFTVSAGAYAIALDTEQLTVSIVRIGEAPVSDFVGLLGEAAPNGWSLDQMTPLAQDAADPNVFVYEGPLKRGEFRFSADRSTHSGSDWDTLRFIVSASAVPSLADTRIELVAGGNRNWRIEQAGDYRITIDLKALSIAFTRLGGDDGTGDLGDYGNGEF